jgi:hypothetical protein
LKLKEWKWTSQFEYWKLTSLIAKDDKWVERFNIWNVTKAREIDTPKQTPIKAGLELHTCLKCWKESMADVFEWKYWPCFVCEHCKWYSKPNPTTSSHGWPDWYGNQ